jgi:hypothetical protein
MARKSRIGLGGLACLMVGIAIRLFNAHDADSSVTLAATARVDIGMTADDVESILGGPPGDYSTHSNATTSSVKLKSEGDNNTKVWLGNDGLAVVKFDERRQVDGVSFIEFSWMPESVLDRVQRWVGLSAGSRPVNCKSRQLANSRSSPPPPPPPLPAPNATKPAE